MNRIVYVLLVLSQLRLLQSHRYFERHSHKSAMSSRSRAFYSKSRLLCATHCAETRDCHSFIFPCSNENSRCHGDTDCSTVARRCYGDATCVDEDRSCHGNVNNCELFLGDPANVVMIGETGSCYYRKIPRVYAASPLAWDFCGAKSSLDYIIITDAGALVYDVIDDIIASSPCGGPVAMATIFTGYGDLPQPWEVDGLTLYDWSTMELYSGGRVWTWEAKVRKLSPVNGYHKLMTSLYGTNVTSQPVWVTSRSHRRLERHFYARGGRIHIHVAHTQSSDVIENVTLGQTSRDDVGFDQNPWHALMDHVTPSHVVSVMQVDVGSDKYAVILDDNRMYVMDIDYSANPSSPVVSMTFSGVIRLEEL